MKKIQIIIFIMLSVIACKKGKITENRDVEIENKEVPPEKRAEKDLYDEVMDVHDEAMPKMDNLMKLKGKLQEKYDIGKDQQTTPESDLEKYQEAIQKLEAADDAMMDWMHKFEPQEGNTNHDEVMKYYQQQKESITKVNEQMEEAMKNAQATLNQ
ncbi:hypothetical protein LVD15_12350 [Fulvivirga maritima]|uniref:hypothetical protein n=1 Tax=Fulvivirga maritima TaxID=2904247 RepID=UPI001F327DCC|nr:hypothetical protein [Fulvivirga maritima]UII29181.1 hypothetical protein LVD15_12350 [Fulvivirga maritima]